MEEYESVLIVKNEVFVYKIPPRTTNRGYRAADWNLQTPDWTGRMRLVCKGRECFMKLEDKLSGELFAKCPIDKYPGIAVEAVMDSSRYFVIRIQDDNGRSAFIGLGFADRGDSFDLNVALQDHFKWLQKTEEIEQEEKSDDKPQLDLSFKEGQTIKINMKIAKSGGGSNRSRPKSASGTGILPPPPGGIKLPPPGSSKNSSSDGADSSIESLNCLGSENDSHTSTNNNCGLLLDLDAHPNAGSGSGHPVAAPNQGSYSSASAELWGDFASAESADPVMVSKPPVSNASSSNNTGWVQF